MRRPPPNPLGNRRPDPCPARRLALVGLAGLVSPIASAQTWEPAPDLPTQPDGRELAAGLEYHGSLVALGGTPFTPNLDGVVHELAPGASSWTEAHLVEGTIVHHGVGVDALDRIIVFGGAAAIGDDTGKAYVYDLVEGKQGNVAPRGAQAPDALFAWATDDEGRIYSLGGGPGASATPAEPNVGYAERYDGPADSWQVLAPMPTPAADAAGVYDGRGHVLVVGGYAASGGAALANVAEYDIASDAWSDVSLPDLPVAVSGARAVLGVDGRVYVMGGFVAGVAQRATWVLDLELLAWSAGPDMLTPRAGFAAALGEDGYVYAMGGSDGGAGTWAVERLLTPTCPSFPVPPEDLDGWAGSNASFTVEVGGTPPMQFQWRRDGVPLSDGPALGGGRLEGTATRTLVIRGAGIFDAALYDVVVSNDCGARVSPAATLAMHVPVTVTASGWTVSNLHPSGALQSSLSDVSGTQIVGAASYPHPIYNALSHPMLWSTAGGAPIDLTPVNSVGGAARAVAGGVQVGWYWLPETGGGYEKRACSWSGSAGSHDHIQISGAYGEATDTDGLIHVGTITASELPAAPVHGVRWSETGGQYSLTPADATRSSASALFDGHQYGSAYFPGPNQHRAARWSGSAASFRDLAPEASSYSHVRAAGLGQQVGEVQWGTTTSHAGLWTGTPESFIDLNPAHASSSRGYGVENGLQVGVAYFPAEGGGARAVLWSGAPKSRTWVRLHDLLGPEYSWSTAIAIDHEPGQPLRVAGYGFNVLTDRQEALLWEHPPIQHVSSR